MYKDANGNKLDDCFTEHAILRAAGRLKGLVREQDIQKIQKLAPKYSRAGKVYLMLHRFGKCIDTMWEGNFPINGDCLVAVLEDGKVKTVMVTKSWRRDYFYRDSKLGLVG